MFNWWRSADHISCGPKKKQEKKSQGKKQTEKRHFSFFQIKKSTW